jgi:hypothetical protein
VSQPPSSPHPRAWLPGLHGWLPGATVLVTGFVALRAFWAFGAHPAALPGLFAFPSAT